MHDILPEQAVRWQWLEDRFRALVTRYGFGEVRTPLLEPTELFVRGIGEATDVVEKEMYSFDRHDDRLTVRPEGTASCVRAYVQHNVAGLEPVTRWYYVGPMFRAERPAKGRFRQFHQAGCEIYGDAGPLCDAELIALSAEIVTALGVSGFRIHLNSIGSRDTKERYREALRAFLEPHEHKLGDESRRRLHTNPLRILDSKSPTDQEVVAGAPSVLDVLQGDDADHFTRLRHYLDALEVPYIIDPKLVRGLDYYTRTLFELKITSGELGAQDALLGGGRYDNMVADLGGKPVPAIGFAMGLERILSVTDPKVPARVPACYFAPMGEEGRVAALKMATALREKGFYCEVDGRGQSLKSMLRRANTLGSMLCVLCGEDELRRGVVAVKDLGAHAQEELPLEGAVAALAQKLAARLAAEPADKAG
jgi:histidyl-tRNA synthetase